MPLQKSRDHPKCFSAGPLEDISVINKIVVSTIGVISSNECRKVPRRVLRSNSGDSCQAKNNSNSGTNNAEQNDEATFANIGRYRENRLISATNLLVGRFSESKFGVTSDMVIV